MIRPRPFPLLDRVEFYLCQEQDLVAAVARAIARHLTQNPSSRPTTDQEAVQAWARMAIDVPNGGFTQFFYNHGGDQGVAPLADLLDSIGVPKAGALIREATSIYRRHQPEFAVENPWEGLFGSIPEFEKLDRAFAGIVLRCNRALETWVRSRIGDLADDETGKPIDAQFTGSVENYHPNGVVRESLEVKKGKAHGAYREFFDDGSILNVVFYKSGKLTGDFWPEGGIKRKESRRGNLTIIEFFHPGGQLQKRYVKDKSGYAVEPIRLYHANGQLAEEIATKEGDKLGPWLKFFDDGSPQLQAEFAAGNKLIVHNAWDDDRNQVVTNGTGRYRDDGLRIDWEYDVFFDHMWQHEMELKDGVPHGTVTKYNRGVLWSVDHYENGLQEGKSTLYWNNGRVRAVAHYSQGTAGREKSFPKFDEPKPAVLLKIVADEGLYKAWKHIPVDEYPAVLNLDEVRRQLKVPDFLREVYQRNLTRTLKSEYEDWSSFDDGIAYFLTVSAAGEVTGVWANGSGVFSGGSWNIYKPLLSELRFKPGRIRGRAIECRVLARVEHTFVEGKIDEKAR